MNTAEYVTQQIKTLKDSGIPLSDAAWETGKLCIGYPYIFGDRGAYCTAPHRKAVYNSHPDQTGLIDKCKILKSGAKSCAGCQWFPSGERVLAFDCRGFTYWILKQIYGWELKGAGATSQWNTESNWKSKGTIDTIPENTLVCLFYTQKGNPKVMQHTGLGYKGETLECGNGVQYFKTRNKKWTHWAIPMCVENREPTPTPPEPTPEKGTAIVTGKNVALRKGPSTTSAVITRVPQGKVVKLAEIPDEWEYVEYSGKQGFMMKEFLNINK